MGMRRRMGILMAATVPVVGLATIGALVMGGGETAPKTVTSGGVVVDAPADAVAEKGQPITQPGRVDITGVSAEYRPGGLALTVSVREPSDPYVDPSWTGGGAFLSWEVDTTGDGKEDYEISYVNDDGNLTGEISTPERDAFCFVSGAGFDPAVGYTVVVNPSCLENPKSVAYRVTYYYQTDESSPLITDTAPDKGMTPMLMTPGRS